ncbi:hypothetical protein [Streptomyces sp. NPDC048663]|uniref:hypothetical protein n=1 Tax=Streptomyces sp. NPDC048663 TaxID=3155638 RepID=UPI0034249374
MRAFILGALAGLLWVLAPGLVSLAAAVALTALAKAAPAALVLAAAARALPRIRRWAR